MSLFIKLTDFGFYIPADLLNTEFSIGANSLTPLVFKWSSGILVHSFTSASVALQAVLEKT